MGAIRDHYEVLGVTCSVSDEDLKKAYRRLALIWHPDKNPHRVEEAKKEFQIIQAAYDVLSDPQERRWYDEHKDLYEFGDYKDESVDVQPYCTSTCFTGFDDSPRSFYSIYRELFTRIASEDLKFKNEDDVFEVPHFGFSNSSYDEVVGPFYAYWRNYCTSKPFTWLDKYDIRQAPNRRILKLMERENKKLRDKAKKARNEEVRNLVAFVRRRDNRVYEHTKLLEKKAAENARKAALKAEENRQKQLEERRTLLEETREARRLQMKEMESQLKNIEELIANENGDVSEDDTYISENENDKRTDGMNSFDQGLYCPACNKVFKTVKAFQNHENSKRHAENVEILRFELLKDQEELDKQDIQNDENMNSEEEGVPSDEVPDTDSELEVELDELKEQKSKKNKRKPKTFELNDESDIKDINRFIDVANEEATFSDDDCGKRKKGKKARINKKESEKKAKIQQVQLNEEKDCKQEKENDHEKDEELTKAKRKRRKVKKESEKEGFIDVANEKAAFSDDDCGKRKKGKKAKINKKESQQKAKIQQVELNEEKDCKQQEENDHEELTKAKQKRRKVKKESEKESMHLRCVKCKTTYSSKNKLFEHLKESGHATFIEKDVENSKGKKAKKQLRQDQDS